MPESLLTLLNKKLWYKCLPVNFVKLLRKPVLQALGEKSPYSELFRSTFFPHFLIFGLNAERYSVSLRIQAECGKMREKCGPE